MLRCPHIMNEQHELSELAPLLRRNAGGEPEAPTFTGPFWDRHLRAVALLEKHQHELNSNGVRIVKHYATVTFDDYCDVRREGLADA